MLPLTPIDENCASDTGRRGTNWRRGWHVGTAFPRTNEGVSSYGAPRKPASCSLSCAHPICPAYGLSPERDGGRNHPIPRRGTKIPWLPPLSKTCTLRKKGPGQSGAGRHSAMVQVRADIGVVKAG